MFFHLQPSQLCVLLTESISTSYFQKQSGIIFNVTLRSSSCKIFSFGKIWSKTVFTNGCYKDKQLMTPHWRLPMLFSCNTTLKTSSFCSLNKFPFQGSSSSLTPHVLLMTGLIWGPERTLLNLQEQCSKITPRNHLNIKMSSYQYRDPHVKDKTDLWPSSL